MAKVTYKYQELIPTAKFANSTIFAEIEKDCEDGQEEATLNEIVGIAEGIVVKQREEVLSDIEE